MTEETAHERPVLSDADTDALTRRREALHQAVTELDRELDALEAEPEPDRERFRAAMHSLLPNLRQHIEETEAAEGLLGRIAADAPWFGPRVEQLRGEHDGHLADANTLLERAAGQADVAPLVAEARELSHRLSEHRHRGTTLLMDTYMLDIPEAD